MQEKDKKKPAGEKSKSKDKRRNSIEPKTVTTGGAGTDPVPTPDGHK